MVKAKKSSSDNVRQKKKTAEVRPNPFEVKFNKQHHNVLGRKMMKNDKGRPGVARNRAMKKVSLMKRVGSGSRVGSGLKVSPGSRGTES